jgi:hypothetical protein
MLCFSAEKQASIFLEFFNRIGTKRTPASYDMISSHRLILFVEQNSRLNEDEYYRTHQAVNVDF